MTRETRVAEILADWRLRWESGERLDPRDVIRAHPDLAADLAVQFAVVRALDRAVDRPPPGGAPAPRRLGPYRLIGELGRGGMGTVHLAEVEGEAPGLRVGDRVALKVLGTGLPPRPGLVERFLREARAGFRVRHPNVVRTLDAGVLETDGPTAHYLVMEYVEGRTLAELLEDLGTVPEALVREIGRQLAEGLAAIHAKGIVHRDLKPENAIITGDHEVRITDLGVARLLDESLALTAEGHFAGSLPYAAPEQFRGEEVGPAADLYSLGVVLYELATGVNPFRRDEPAAMMRAHLEHVPPRARERNPEASLFLSEVLATLLGKEPSARFGGAEDLLRALEEGEASPWWTDRDRALERKAPRVPRVPVRRETKLHGREGDLALLRETWGRAAGGEGACLLVEGEAGIGKSRLVDAFLEDLAGDAAHVLYGSYPPSGGLGGLSEAILGHFGAAGLEEALHPYLEATPSLVPAFAALVRHESPPAGAAEISGDALHAVFCHLLKALAAERPLLWVVEDLHFAEPDTRKVLLSLARALEGHRVLLLLTARPGVPEEELAHFGRLPRFRRTALSRLSAREVVLLLVDAFRSEALADKLGARIALKSDGVPFFVFEMIRGLSEGQFITELPDGSFVATKEVERIEVPSAVRDLIGARLRGLTKEERALLDVGAVHGFTFDPDLVARTLERPRMAVLQDLAEIDRRSGVVRSVGASFHFDHHQIQEVVYEELPEGLRKEYHSQLARALAGGEGADPREVPGETAFQVAFHHLRGREPGEAAPFLEPALDHLAKAYRNDALLDLARRALAEEGLLTGEERVSVLVRKADVLGLPGLRDEQAACLEEASVLADENGDPGLRARVGGARCRLLFGVSRYEEALGVRRESRILHREAGDRRGEARAAAGIGTACLFLGRHEEAEESLRAAIDLAREVGDVDAESGATINLGLVLLALGHRDRAREHFERGADLARRCGNRKWEVNAVGSLGNVFLRQGRYDDATGMFERAGAVSREIGYRTGEAFAWVSLGRVRSAQGRHEEAVGSFERGLAVLRETGDRQGEADALNNLGSALMALGRLEQAKVRYERSLEIRRETGARQGEAATVASLGTLLATLGVEAARDRLESSLAIARRVGDPSTEAYVLSDLAGLACRRGEPEEGLALLGESIEIYRRIGEPVRLGLALADEGGILADEGRAEEARRHLEEALALGRETGAPGPVVLAACRLAPLPGGDPAAAAAALGEHEGRLALGVRMEARFLLFRATEDPAHLEEAHRLLTELRDHAPEEHRESMVENVPLHREIARARADAGGAG